MRVPLLASLVLLAVACPAVMADTPTAQPQWLSLPGKDGPGKGKSIVLIAGSNEYGPETGLPLLASILSDRHGFGCTVLFTIDPKTGDIDPDTTSNIPGLEALDHADLMIILARFRDLPDEQMKHVVDYLESGRPVIGMRTATHAFNYPASSTSPYKKFTWTSKEPGFDGGFGRQVLGETWINHHAPNATTSTRGVFAPGAAGDPILRGIADGEIWARTGVYDVRLPLLPGCKTLLLGQVIDGPKPTDKPAEGKLNDPMMPVAWSKTYTIPGGKTGRAFTTTMGSDQDLQDAPLRRLIVNAAYWATGMEDKIPEKADVDLVGAPIRFKKGMKPADFRPR